MQTSPKQTTYRIDDNEKTWIMVYTHELVVMHKYNLCKIYYKEKTFPVLHKWKKKDKVFINPNYIIYKDNKLEW